MQQFLEGNGHLALGKDAAQAESVGRAICDRFDAGDSFDAVSGQLLDRGLPPEEAAGVIWAATVVFCPKHGAQMP